MPVIVLAQISITDLAETVNRLGAFQLVGFIFLVGLIIYNMRDKRHSELEQLRLKNAVANTAQDNANASAYLRLIENVVSANTQMAQQIPDALDLIREQSDKQLAAWQGQSGEMLKSTKEALNQLATSHERYSAIQGAADRNFSQITMVQQLITELGAKIDTLNCVDKEIVKAAIREVGTETIQATIAETKKSTDELPIIQEKKS